MSGLFLTFVLLLFSFTQPGLAQSSEELKALRDDLATLKEGQKKIQKELEAIRTFLLRQVSQARRRQAPQPFQPVVLSLRDNPTKGNPKAKVTILDFSDYQ